MSKLTNSQGKVFFGIHFYPGVAEYQENNDAPYRIFLNEDTLRKMDSTFAGKPVFVEHVDGVEPSIDELRKEADGWVIKSFYNAKDGKHWVEFIVVSERGMRAVKNGWKLSNAYLPKTSPKNGLWNGVEYSREIIGGEFEHLAIVQTPRYEESVILTPEEFKKYNEDKEVELKRLANSQENNKGDEKVKFNFFKREKVANSADLESTIVELPKSKVEISISNALIELDTIKNMHGYANEDHMVKMGNEEMSVKDLVKKHQELCNEVEKMKNADMDEADMDVDNSEESLAEDEKDVGDRGGDKNLNADEDKKEEEKKKNAKEKAQAVKNAKPSFESSFQPKIDLMADKLARGRELF